MDYRKMNVSDMLGTFDFDAGTVFVGPAAKARKMLSALAGLASPFRPIAAITAVKPTKSAVFWLESGSAASGVSELVEGLFEGIISGETVFPKDTVLFVESLDEYGYPGCSNLFFAGKTTAVAPVATMERFADADSPVYEIPSMCGNVLILPGCHPEEAGKLGRMAGDEAGVRKAAANLRPGQMLAVRPFVCLLESGE